jgi:hypothetical protein
VQWEFIALREYIDGVQERAPELKTKEITEKREKSYKQQFHNFNSATYDEDNQTIKHEKNKTPSA